MKKIILLIAIAFLSFSFANAEPAKKETIQELLKVMKIDSTLDKTFNNIFPTIVESIKAQYLDSAKSEELDELFFDLTNEMTKIMKDITRRMIDEDMVNVYQKYFTEEDILEMIKFHKSPTGQKLVDATPAITQDMMSIMFTKYMPYIQERMMELAKEMLHKKTAEPLKKS